MSRQNNHSRDRKQEGTKRDAASSGDRYLRNEREQKNQQPAREERVNLSGLDRYRLNDLYERSSI